jgi:hypothetical protein
MFLNETLWWPFWVETCRLLTEYCYTVNIVVFDSNVFS